MAEHVSCGYQNAKEASKTFDNVFVINSGHLSSGNYVELQFHGGVSAEDIDYISLSRNAPNAKEIEELAQKAGVKVKWTK